VCLKLFLATAVVVLSSAHTRAQTICSSTNPCSLYQYQVVATFPQNQGSYPVGRYPNGSLVEIRPGVFVGTTNAGGPQPQFGECTVNTNAGCGTIYQLDTTTTPATISLLYAFSGTKDPISGLYDGALPQGTIAWDGTYVYGTTSWSTNSGCALPNPCGSIYRFKLSTLTLEPIYDMYPNSPLRNPGPGVLFSNGHLYGVTNRSDDFTSDGALFEYVSPSTVGPGTAPNVTKIDNTTIGLYPQALADYFKGERRGASYGSVLWRRKMKEIAT